MIVIVKKSTAPAAVEALSNQLRSLGVDVHLSQGSVHTVLGLVGDTSKLDIDQLTERLKEAQKLLKLCKDKLYTTDEQIKAMLKGE